MEWHLICILQIDSADYAIFDVHVADRFADPAVLIGILQIDSADRAFFQSILPSRSILFLTQMPLHTRSLLNLHCARP